jgi:hypothetical protein
MPGPWGNDVLVYRMGRDGKVTQVATLERAGVPTIAPAKDGRLIAAHQHFPENDEATFDKVAVRFSSDDGKAWPVMWTAEVGSGRVFVSGVGHNDFTFNDPYFRIILLRAMAWTMHESFDPFKPLVTLHLQR